MYILDRNTGVRPVSYSYDFRFQTLMLALLWGRRKKEEQPAHHNIIIYIFFYCTVRILMNVVVMLWGEIDRSMIRIDAVTGVHSSGSFHSQAHYDNTVHMSFKRTTLEVYETHAQTPPHSRPSQYLIIVLIAVAINIIQRVVPTLLHHPVELCKVDFAIAVAVGLLNHLHHVVVVQILLEVHDDAL
jgi:hypothetical protein